MTNTTLNDQAVGSINGGTAPFTGSFRPEGLLSALNGKNAVGAWKLEITDDARKDTGTLDAWSLTISEAASMASAAAIVDAAAIDAVLAVEAQPSPYRPLQSPTIPSVSANVAEKLLLLQSARSSRMAAIDALMTHWQSRAEKSFAFDGRPAPRGSGSELAPPVSPSIANWLGPRGDSV
jgi:hypothetical protein